MVLAVTEDGIYSCCASKAFAAKLAASAPFPDFPSLVDRARSTWWKEVSIMEWMNAFAAHPKIGDNKAVETKPEAFREFSRSEQAAAAASTSEDVARDLREYNEAYFNKFGFIFIICAKGKSSPEILEQLKMRYNRTPYEELQAAASEQMKITEMRLAALLGVSADLEVAQRSQRRADQPPKSDELSLPPTTSTGALLRSPITTHVLPIATPVQPITTHVLPPTTSTGAPLRSPITTHVLDQALGCPAQGLPLKLLRMDLHSQLWESLNSGITNEDGRVGNLLPPSGYIAPGRYRMHFDTATYLKVCKLRHPAFYSNVPFYPEVSVDFEITEEGSTQHFHIPLLLSPYGYSTYRGS